MGLDISHGAWDGAYSAFMRWRTAVAEAAGIPLPLMEGYYRGAPDRRVLEYFEPRDGGPQCQDYRGPALYNWVQNVAPSLPIKWESLRPDPLLFLLNHSDCDGWIPPATAGRIADRLEQLLPIIEARQDAWGHITNWGDVTRQFIAGCRLACARKERLVFY